MTRNTLLLWAGSAVLLLGASPIVPPPDAAEKLPSRPPELLPTAAEVEEPAPKVEVIVHHPAPSSEGPEVINHAPKPLEGHPAKVETHGDAKSEKHHEEAKEHEEEEHHHHGHEAGIHFEEIEHPGNGISPRLDYLIWKARRRALDFAILDPNRTNNVPEGPIASVFYDTDNGVRAGFTFSLPNPEWEAAAYYTYFHAHGNQTFTALDRGVIYPTVLSPIGPREVTGAFAQANVDLDIVDLQIGPRLAVGECFLLQFYGGLRTAHIHTKFNAFYTGRDAGNIDENFTFLGTRYFDDARFRGLGLRLGGEGSYRFAEYCTVFMRGSTSLLSGRFSESHMEDNGNAILFPQVNVAEKWEQLVPVVDLAVGVTYQFREDMRLALGYEFAHWFGLTDSSDFVDDVAVGKLGRRTSDLTFEGLFLQLAVSF